MDINTVILTGRLTKDVDVKMSSTGSEIANYTIAISHWNKDPEKAKVSFIDCVSFTHTAKYLSKYVAKGDEIMVHGEIEQQTWNNKEGEKKSKITVRCIKANLIRKKNGTQSSGGSAHEETAPMPDDEYNF